MIKSCICRCPTAALTFTATLFRFTLLIEKKKLFRVLLIKTRRELAHAAALRLSRLRNNELIRVAAAFRQIFSSLQLFKLSAAAPAELCLLQACVCGQVGILIS